MSYGLSRMMIRLSRGVVYQMRKELFERLGTLPVSFFDTHQTGDVISVFSYDVDTVNASPVQRPDADAFQRDYRGRLAGI